ncbi:MAG: nuclease [Actinomycetia bacterium]|nr:nuclease [Actinomycetes bacterium]
MAGVIVLNASYEVINVVPVAKAVAYVLKEKAEVVHADAGRVVRSINRAIPLPRIVRLLRYVRIPYRSAVPRWSRVGVLERDRFTCAYCGGRATTVDHVLPRSRGGGDTWLNTVASCGPCNNAKGSRTPAEAGLRSLFEAREPRQRTSLLLAVGSLDRELVSTLGIVLA